MKCGIKNCAGLYFPEDANCCTNECGESEACINDDDGRCDGDDDNDGNGDAGYYMDINFGCLTCQY